MRRTAIVFVILIGSVAVLWNIVYWTFLRTTPTPAPAIVEAAEVGDVSAVRVMIAHAVNLEQTNHRGETALMVSIRRHNFNIANILLKAGANPNATDVQGNTALGTALARHDAQAVEWIKTEGGSR